MHMLVIDQRGAALSMQGGALVIRTNDKRPTTIPLGQVSRLVIAAAVEVNSSLFTHLAARDISVIIMPGRGARRNAILYGSSHGDAARRIGQYASLQDSQFVMQWARRFVSMRLVGSLRLLRHAELSKSDKRHDLRRGVSALSRAIEGLENANSLPELRGMEGAAASAFFAAYRSLFPASLSFKERNRRPPRDPVNAALSLGYALVHGDAVRALTQTGLDPMLGYLHDPSYNRESLACDFVELARPRIERFVWRLFARQQLRLTHFTIDSGAFRMSKAARPIYFGTYEKQAALHRKWFARYARAIVQHVGQRGTSDGIQQQATKHG